MAQPVLFIIAHADYQPVEYKDPKETLEENGYTVVTASDQAGTATAKDGSTTDVDLTLEEIEPSEYAGIFFIGGPGAMDHVDGELAYYIAQRAQALRIPHGAICIATRILAASGVLEDKKATGWNGDSMLPDIFDMYDVEYQPDQEVVVDGIVITATGPDAAVDFGKAIVNVLQETE